MRLGLDTGALRRRAIDKAFSPIIIAYSALEKGVKGLINNGVI